MDFRLTKRKVITSIVIPVIMWIGVFMISFFESYFQDTPKFLYNFLSLHDMINIISSGNITIFIFEVVIVYVIMSIFQRRRRVIVV
ncbi:hypothetical protein GOV12_06930 [Candidatus Pacearchaeota archaeon]|nr:hypothetical protein [Candidatus Pacearchaeota archaeon]